MKLLFSLLALLPLVLSDPQCPTGPITSSGKFPDRLTPLSNGYRCAMNFNITDGYMVKFNFNAVLPVFDTSEIYLFTAGEFMGIGGVGTYYAPATATSLVLQITQPNAAFYVEYEFVNVQNYTKIQKYAGDYILMNFPATSYVTFTNEQFGALTLAFASTLEKDLTYYYAYVYDGADLSAPCLGRLMHVVGNTPMTKSSSNSITIANFWGMELATYVIANDYSSVFFYDRYELIINNDHIPAQASTVKGIMSYSAFSVVCDNCDTVYIESMQYSSYLPNATVEIYPMSPSYTRWPTMTYRLQDMNINTLPLQIPAKQFWIVIRNANMFIGFSSSSAIKKQWLAPAAGRKITLMSRSLWTPTESPMFNYQFQSQISFNYTLTDVTIAVKRLGERLRLKIGTPGKSNNLQKDFTCDSSGPPCVRTNYQPTSAPGTYCSLNYIGSDTQSWSGATLLINNL